MANSERPWANSKEFVQRIKPFRRELLAHCYRMLGSVGDAEDVVQQTYLRAWLALDRFEGRSSFRAWLYKIATNVCLTERHNRDRRVLPSGLGEPAHDPLAPQVEAGPEVSWVEPLPDELITPESDDPAAVAAARQGVRLALIASLQYLPAGQRAVLLLREVLGYSGPEVAEMLDTTLAAVKSTLQRARAQLDTLAPAADQIREPTEPEARALLERYIAAFESSDAAAIEQLLRSDATLEMVPSRTWFAGKKTCAPYLAARALGAAGDWRMVPTRANGQPAVEAYLRGTDGAHHPFGLAVLTLDVTGIARIVVFGGAEVLRRFKAYSVSAPPEVGQLMA